MEVSRHGRKLLIASLGVAAVTYVACGGDDTTPGASDAATGGTAGSMIDAGASGPTTDAKPERGLPGFDAVVANLMISPYLEQ